MVKIIKITDQEYVFIKNLVYNRFGIDLGFHKKSLVMGRLNKILRNYGFEDFKTYYRYLHDDKSGKALAEFINRISTNHTFFYRENSHYDYLSRTYLSEVLEYAKKCQDSTLRIWSAACSSGEEPFTLAMVINEFFEEHQIRKDFVILGTDISIEALEKAEYAKYKDENVKKLPVRLKLKYLTPLSDSTWEINDYIKSKVVFKKFNLMSNTFPFKKKFHAIFCRNVMIYFDQKTRDNLINKMAPFLIDQGRLFIGLSESINRSNPKFQYVEPGVYRKVTIH